MASLRRGLSVFSKHTLPLATFLGGLLLTQTMAQQTPEPVSPAASPSSATSAQKANAAKPQESVTVTVPAGTRLALVLSHPVDSKTVHRGDDIYAQITSPVAIADRVVIPAGTFLQGQVEKLSRQGSRGEFQMRSLSLMFPNGYIASVKGPLTVESGEGTAWMNPSGTAKAGAIAAPAAGLGVGALIGSSAHTTQTIPWATGTKTVGSLKGVAIGSMVGLAAGGATALVLLARTRHFYVDVGSPMDLTLAQPLSVLASQVQAAGNNVSNPVVITPVARRPLPAPPTTTDHRICYTPGSPGTPATVIPGIPATPNSPGTPDVVIPGTPPAPGTPYPCP